MIERAKHFETQHIVAQRGSALVVSLIMLLLLSIIAVGAMQSSILQERMSSSMHDRELAFQAAETALRDAERVIRTQTADWLSIQNFTYQVNGLNPDGDAPPNWLANPADNSGSFGNLEAAFPGVSRQPNYYIEEIDAPVGGSSTELGVEDPGSALFRITARGFGGTEQTTVVVRSVYRTR